MEKHPHPPPQRSLTEMSTHQQMHLTGFEAEPQHFPLDRLPKSGEHPWSRTLPSSTPHRSTISMSWILSMEFDDEIPPHGHVREGALHIEQHYRQIIPRGHRRHDFAIVKLGVPAKSSSSFSPKPSTSRHRTSRCSPIYSVWYCTASPLEAYLLVDTHRLESIKLSLLPRLHVC